MKTQLEKAERFRDLHLGPDTFFIPNPWDAGSARLLQGLGFQALATTSSGFAFTLGRLDGQVSLDEKLAHIQALSEATDIPLSADLENCFADDPAAAAETIRLAAAAGAVGGSVEDYSGNPDNPIYDFDLAVARVQAAVAMARSLSFPFTLTARAETLLHGVGDIDEAIRRLQAFEAAGADVLYAPGLRTLADVRRVTSAVNKPVNVLGTMVAGASLADFSVGGSMAFATVAKAIEAGHSLLKTGNYDWASNRLKPGELASLLG